MIGPIKLQVSGGDEDNPGVVYLDICEDWIKILHAGRAGFQNIIGERGSFPA